MSLPNLKSGDLEAVEIYDQIYMIENFLTEEECNYLHAYAEAATEEDWQKLNYSNILNQAKELHGDNQEEIEAYIKRNLNPFYDNKVISIPRGSTSKTLSERLAPFIAGAFRQVPMQEIQRQYKGVPLNEHYDQGYDKRLVRATVTYINDDYVDGELYFVAQGIKFRPPKGSLVTFPATPEFVHGVKPVGDGPTRYVIPSFLWETGDYNWIEDH